MQYSLQRLNRSIHPEVFLEKGEKEHPCRSVISIKLPCNFIKITLRHGCSPGDFLRIFRTPFLKNTSGWLLLIKVILQISFPNVRSMLFTTCPNEFGLKDEQCASLLQTISWDPRTNLNNFIDERTIIR